MSISVNKEEFVWLHISIRKKLPKAKQMDLFTYLSLAQPDELIHKARQSLHDQKS